MQDAPSEHWSLTTRKVDRYDGQSIYIQDEIQYELGGYLGGGAAGVVYEAVDMKNKEHAAIKILNPIGYKLTPTSLLARCSVIIKGRVQIVNEKTDELERMTEGHVWWLMHPHTKAWIAAFEDPRTHLLRELTLPKCIEIWGLHATEKSKKEERSECNTTQHSENVPRLPPKFKEFAIQYSCIFREIAHMSGLRRHENVVQLCAALELVQDTKVTFFLVLDLATGGELFDRIQLDCGTDEKTAHYYFQQLISGVAFCHEAGICHRDLKPENLLLADGSDGATLKIADFGLSAIFSNSSEDIGQGKCRDIRRLRSVVGSPHYVAPEVLQDTGQGYDGAKVDAWSAGIILYALLAGNLPFGKDLLKCVRYDRFRRWSFTTKYDDDGEMACAFQNDPCNQNEDPFPPWFFPLHFSQRVKSLVAQLLYPDPSLRLSILEAAHHTWVVRGPSPSPKSSTAPLVSDNTKPLDTKPLDNWNTSIISPRRRSWESTNIPSNNALAILQAMRSPEKNVMPSVAENGFSFFQENDEDDDDDDEEEEEEEEELQHIKCELKSSPVQILRAHHSHHFMSPQLMPKESELDIEAYELSLRTLSWDNQAQHTTTVGTTQSSSIPRSSSFEGSREPGIYRECVKRSTRFTTSIPAVLVLRQIESIVVDTFGSANVVDIEWSSYQMHISTKDVLTCSIQVFLLQTGVYLVEFRRGQIDIFQFKRFYAQVKEDLAQCVRNQNSMQLIGPSNMTPPRLNISISAEEMNSHLKLDF